MIFSCWRHTIVSLVVLVTGLVSSIAQSTGDHSSSTGTHSTTGMERDDAVSVEYRWYYIIASYLVATIGSGTALQVMKQRTGLYGLRNWLLLLGGAISLGVVGIWCMHFVGMLSLTIKDANGYMLRMGFEPGLTTASLIIGVSIIAVGFALAGDPKRAKIWRTCGVGFVGGCGVAAMHYTGMMAMRCQATITWNAGIIVASVFVGIFAATAALLIFFHLAYLWQDDMRLQIATAMIMGVAVNGMHYTGMVAASWKNSFVEPNFAGYATSEALTGAIIALAVVTCAVLLGILFYRYKLIQQIETKKTACLTLSALLRDSQGRVLSTLALTLPSVVIDSAYSGSTSTSGFNRLNADFLRMLKISFSWSNVQRYQKHLEKLHQQQAITTSSLKLFENFVLAAEKLALQLNIPLTSIGFAYWSPIGNMVTLIVKPSAANSRSLQDSESGLRFMPPQAISAALAQYQLTDTEIDPLEWLADVKDYARRVLLPLTGESKRDEMLNEFLRDTATELLIETDSIEEEIRQWRQILGRYVITRHHLNTLAKNPAQWSQVKLEPMVKAQIDAQIANETMLALNNAAAERAAASQDDVTSTGKGELLTDGSRAAKTLHPASSTASITAATISTTASLYLGLLYVQASSTGLKVLLPREGPLTMIPIVKLTNQHANITTRELEWLREGAGGSKKAFKGLSQMNKKGGGGGGGGSVPDIVPATATASPSVQQGQQSSFEDQLPNGPGPSPKGGHHERQGSLPDALSRDNSHLGTSTATVTRNNAPKVYPPSFFIFQADFNKAVDELGKSVGTKVDLTMQNLWTEVIVLSPEVQLICFVHSTMNAVFPVDYSPQLSFFLPFPIFEILHYSQHTSRSASNWTRRLVAATVQTKKTALVAAGVGATGDDKAAAVALAAAAGDADQEMHSIFGSEKTAMVASLLTSDSDTDDGELMQTHEEASILNQKGVDDSMLALYASQSPTGTTPGTPLNHLNGGFSWESHRTASDGTTYLPGQPEPQVVELNKVPPRRRESPSTSYAVQQAQDSRVERKVGTVVPRHVSRGTSRRSTLNMPLAVKDSLAPEAAVLAAPVAVSTPSRPLSLPTPIGDRPNLVDATPDVVIHVHSRDPRKPASSNEVSPESHPLTGLPEEASETNSHPQTPLSPPSAVLEPQ